MGSNETTGDEMSGMEKDDGPQMIELEIIQALFNKDAVVDDIPSYENFLEYYWEQVAALIWTSQDHAQAHADGVRNEQASDMTRNCILKVVNVLKGASSKSRDTVVDEIKNTDWGMALGDQSGATVNDCIELAIRVWLMLNVRATGRTSTPDTMAVQWDAQDTLTEFIDQLFPKTNEPMTSNASHRVDTDFNAVGMREYRGTEITWTTSFEDHLRMKYHRKSHKAKLRVFPYKTILMDYLKHNPTPYPKDLLKEAIWTLDLLFPIGDTKTENLLKEEKLLEYVHTEDSSSTAPPGFYRYSHWKARLVELHDEFHAPPQNLWIALMDQRNTVVWWTFWLAFAIAAMTFVFGTIACFFSGVALNKQRA